MRFDRRTQRWPPHGSAETRTVNTIHRQCRGASTAFGLRLSRDLSLWSLHLEVTFQSWWGLPAQPSLDTAVKRSGLLGMNGKSPITPISKPFTLSSRLPLAAYRRVFPNSSSATEAEGLHLEPDALPAHRFSDAPAFREVRGRSQERRGIILVPPHPPFAWLSSVPSLVLLGRKPARLPT